MKILHIDGGRGWRGGQQQALYLLEGLRSKNCESKLVAPIESPLSKRTRQLGIPVLEMGLAGDFDLISAFRLNRETTRFKPDIVHAHCAHAHSLALLAGLHRKSQLVVSRRVDTPPRSGFFNRFKYLRSDISYVCVSNFIAGVLLDYGIVPDRVRTVYSGVSLERIDCVKRNGADELRREFSVRSDELLLGAVGHFSEHKGHRVLIKAMADVCKSHPKTKLIFAGDGELLEPCRRLAAGLGLDKNIIFAGFRKNIPVFIHALDMFVMPSLTEGLGTSLLDAMSARKAIVASRTGGIPEAVHGGENGLLVPPGEPERLAEALVRLIEDEQFRRRLGDAGRAIVEKDFSVGSMVDRTYKLYNELIG